MYLFTEIISLRQVSKGYLTWHVMTLWKTMDLLLSIDSILPIPRRAYLTIHRKAHRNPNENRN